MKISRGARRAAVITCASALAAHAGAARAADPLDEIVVTAAADARAAAGGDRSTGAAATAAGARRRRLPQDHSGLLGDPQGRHGRRSGLPRHGRLARQHPARRRAGARRLRHAHGPADGLRVPGGLRPHRRHQGAADGAARARQFGRRRVVRARNAALRANGLHGARERARRELRPQRPRRRPARRHATGSTGS